MTNTLFEIFQAVMLWSCLYLAFYLAGLGWKHGRGDSHVINITFKDRD